MTIAMGTEVAEALQFPHFIRTSLQTIDLRATSCFGFGGYLGLNSRIGAHIDSLGYFLLLASKENLS